MRRTTLVPLVLLALTPGLASQATALPALSLRDTAGTPHHIVPAPAGTTTVLVFTATGCPISNSYTPSYRELAARYRPQGVRFFAVNASGEPSAAIAKHAQESASLPFPVLLDPEHAAVRALRAKVTPEAFVIDEHGKLRYAGRIDDAWGSRTVRRQVPQSRDLDDALRATLAHRVIPRRRTKAFGCAIAPLATAAGHTTDWTYHKDIAPIVQRSCLECHRAGQVAPFELASYDNVASWGDEIVEFTRGDLMPPWRASGPRHRFVGDRRLPQADKDKIADWVRGGMPEGDRADAPPAVAWPTGWKLGTPDLVIEMPETYSVSAEGQDEFVCFVLPMGLSEDVYVRAVEYQPGNSRVVHHMVSFLDNSGRARELDAADPKPGYRRFGGPGFAPNGTLGGWAPGNEPEVLPEGVARPVQKGADLVLQMHYYKTGKVEKDRSRVGVHLAKRGVTHHLIPYAAWNFGVLIPPGRRSHTIRSRQKIPFRMKVLSALPHMHLLGRRIRLEAELPSGERHELIRIDDWDFNWQLTYTYKDAPVLPEGTILHMEASYDNSIDNPRNPHNPPKLVRWGESSSDEMCFVFLHTIAPDHPRMTLAQLRDSLRGAIPRSLIRRILRRGGQPK